MLLHTSVWLIGAVCERGTPTRIYELPSRLGGGGHGDLQCGGFPGGGGRGGGGKRGGAGRSGRRTRRWRAARTRSRAEVQEHDGVRGLQPDIEGPRSPSM